MVLALLLGALLGGATVVLLQQWRTGTLAATPSRGPMTMRRATPETTVAPLGGLVFVPGSTQRRLA